jgi:hypothetical protein
MIVFDYNIRTALALNDQGAGSGIERERSAATESWDDEAHVDAQFGRANAAYADKVSR